MRPIEKHDYGIKHVRSGRGQSAVERFSAKIRRGTGRPVRATGGRAAELL
jgi:hypothetical protein